MVTWKLPFHGHCEDIGDGTSLNASYECNDALKTRSLFFSIAEGKERSRCRGRVCDASQVTEGRDLNLRRHPLNPLTRDI
jgi:hypothetical protein